MSSGPSDALIALKVLCLADDLSATDRRVAAALIEHFNRSTGRCDPSIGRLAALLGVNRRTVMRAIKTLAKKAYITKVRHGGYYHRNSYTPAWASMRAKEAAWKARCQALGTRQAATTASPLRRPTCHLGDGVVVTQTYLTNQIAKTSVAAAPNSAVMASPRGEPEKGLAKGSSQTSVSISGARQTSSRPTTPSRDVAFDSAERRWTVELTNMLASDQHLFAKVLEVIDEKMKADATAAEVKTRGSGLPLILRQLGHLSILFEERSK